MPVASLASTTRRRGVSWRLKRRHANRRRNRADNQAAKFARALDLRDKVPRRLLASAPSGDERRFRVADTALGKVSGFVSASTKVPLCNRVAFELAPCRGFQAHTPLAQRAYHFGNAQAANGCHRTTQVMLFSAQQKRRKLRTLTSRSAARRLWTRADGGCKRRQRSPCAAFAKKRGTVALAHSGAQFPFGTREEMVVPAAVVWRQERGRGS